MRTTTHDQSQPLSVKLPLFLEAHRRSSVTEFIRGLLTLLGLSAFALLLFFALPLRLAFGVSAGCALLFAGWVLLDTWRLRRRHAAMARAEAERARARAVSFQRVADQVSFEQWMEGVNRECVRRGYLLKPKGAWLSSEEMTWRWHWANRSTPAEAVTAWEEEE